MTAGTTQDIAATLAAFIVRCQVDDVEVERKARVLLCDALVLGAKAAELQDVTAALQAATRDSGATTRWIDGRKLPQTDAVFANAFSVHARFQDDCEMSSWTHPASMVSPVAVAVAENRDAPLADMLAGMVVGYSVAHWLGADGEVAHAVMDRGFRPSPTFGPMMAAAAAARVDKLPVEACADALRAAALLARGTLHSVAAGGYDWRVHNATAAVDGLLAAALARSGLGAATGAIEGPRGFLGVYAGMKTPPDRWTSPPTEDSVLTVWHKPAPILGDNVAAYMAATSMHPSLDSSSIDTVQVEVHDGFVSFPGTQAVTPFDTKVNAIASVRHAVARGLLSGQVTWEHYAPAQRNDPRLARLVECIEVRGRSDLTHTQAVVRVRMMDGSVLESAPEEEARRRILYRDADAARMSAEGLLGAHGTVIASAVLDSPLDTTSRSLMAAIVRD